MSKLTFWKNYSFIFGLLKKAKIKSLLSCNFVRIYDRKFCFGSSTALLLSSYCQLFPTDIKCIIVITAHKLFIKVETEVAISCTTNQAASARKEADSNVVENKTYDL